MRVCPQCQKTNNRFGFNAWVLQVSGTFEEDSDGMVAQVGPLRSTITIKAGKELDAKSCVLTCPACKFQGPKTEFKVVRPCVLTGMIGNAEIQTPIGVLIVNESALASAAEIFTEANLLWSNDYQRDMELF